MSRALEATVTKRLDIRPERDAIGIACECGGYADKVQCTQQEIAEQWCGRRYQCCARAFVCRLCKKRTVCDAQSPEAG